jgi:hypothetical protein
MTGPYIARPEAIENWRQVAEAVPTLAELITVAEWWKNRRGSGREP